MICLICKQISWKVILFSLFFFFFFFPKEQVGCYFLNKGQQGHYSLYERVGSARQPSETVWGKLVILLYFWLSNSEDSFWNFKTHSKLKCKNMNIFLAISYFTFKKLMKTEIVKIYCNRMYRVRQKFMLIFKKSLLKGNL